MKYILILTITFCSTLSFSQNTFSYLGTLILTKNKVISFCLEIQESDGIVNGYSITNLNTHDETKSEISGLYFKNDNSFQLQENQILQTKSEAAINTFCYITMNFRIKDKLKKECIKGTFTGKYLNGKDCASGEIMLVKWNGRKNKIEKEYNEQYQDTSSIKKTKILKDGDNFTINWKSNKAKLFIWDANFEDGDKITLTINGNIILDDFKTTNKRKMIKYKLVKGENTIEIKATNLGNSPPNTSRIEIVDVKNKYPIITQLELGKTAVIKIIK